MADELKIILYPDPRLKKPSVPVQTIDADTRALAARMLELMRESRGVGLAAPQVGKNLRLFVMNPTGEPGDDCVYVNPVLSEASGEEDDEEGCLSLPGITANITRHQQLRLQAQDLDGNSIDQTENGFVARVWQHEFDHLNGVLITDRMGPVARMKARKTLRELEERFGPRK